MRPRWWIFLGALLLCGASLAWAAISGPDPFPTHWGGGGTADSWAPRGSAITLLALTVGGVAALLGILSAFVSKVPDGMINLPPGARSYWIDPEHRPALDALLQRFLLLIGTGVLLLLALSIVGTVVQPDGGAPLGIAIWVFLAAIAVATGHLLWRLVRSPAE